VKNEIIIIGATIRGASDANEFFGPVKVPGTMKKQQTIDAHLDKVAEERAAHVAHPALGYADSILPNDDKYENHAHRPMVAVLASATIQTLDGTVLYHQAETDEHHRGEVALPLVNFLKETYPNQFGYSLRNCDVMPDAIFFGFNLKQIFRIAAFEALRRNLDNNLGIGVPVRMWHNPIGVYDVLDVLLPSPDQRDLDLYSLCRYFGVQATPESLSTDSQQQAAAVAQLVEKAQLTLPRT